VLQSALSNLDFIPLSPWPTLQGQLFSNVPMILLSCFEHERMVLPFSSYYCLWGHIFSPCYIYSYNKDRWYKNYGSHMEMNIETQLLRLLYINWEDIEPHSGKNNNLRDLKIIQSSTPFRSCSSLQLIPYILSHYSLSKWHGPYMLCCTHKKKLFNHEKMIWINQILWKQRMKAMLGTIFELPPSHCKLFVDLFTMHKINHYDLDFDYIIVNNISLQLGM